MDIVEKIVDSYLKERFDDMTNNKNLILKLLDAGFLPYSKIKKNTKYEAWSVFPCNLRYRGIETCTKVSIKRIDLAGYGYGDISITNEYTIYLEGLANFTTHLSPVGTRDKIRSILEFNSFPLNIDVILSRFYNGKSFDTYPHYTWKRTNKST